MNNPAYKYRLLCLWDFTGDLPIMDLRLSSYYTNKDATILVYDVTQWSTFENLDKWIDAALNNFDARHRETGDALLPPDD